MASLQSILRLISQAENSPAVFPYRSHSSIRSTRFHSHYVHNLRNTRRLYFRGFRIMASVADTVGHTSDAPVLTSSEVIERLRARRENQENQQQYLAMYSSVFGGITTDPAAMVIPIDDHMVHRGHGVFDTAIIVDGYLYELDQHLDRILKSASMAKINLPIPYDREMIRRILIRTVSASKCRNGSLRYWLSAGPGDFQLSSSGCHLSALYAVVIQGKPTSRPKGIKVITSSVPMKPPQFAIMKSVNYLPNVLSKMEAEAKIEMKRGDWVCPRCSFMNFARNVKCLECDEARPKRQLNGGEWECPQCDFFNYGRNTLCLRCDCKRPGAPSISNINENFASGNDNGSRATKVDIDSKLAANEEKAQRWFSKISQLDGTSDSSSSIADEDFPEIMPLRKGVNRFVVSTRKTPLERRLANAQYKGNLGNDGVPENNSNELSAANNSLEEKIGQRLDGIFGRTSPNSQSTNLEKEQGTSTNYTSSSGSGSLQYESLKGSNSNYVPFVPLPSDMFAKKPTNSTMESKVVGTDNNKSLSSGSNEWTGSASQSNEMKEVGGTPPRNETEKIIEGKEDAEKSERWFKRVAELHDVTDLPSAISDEDFPEIMPIRKGENRFVVSKKKDRSLTSPAYKRHAATEQSGSSNFVPFVPFPPDYFAKKDKPSSDYSNSKATEAQSNNTRIGIDDGNNAQQADNQETQTSRFNSELRTGSSSWNSEASSNDYVKKESNHNASAAGNPSAASEVQNIREKWSGKSLEGSAVTEPDPLDMSEEAKAQRWFRRVAQIKDISELSQIPDEDFPSIMPMRQGVNRFVVSKRKTPLERRLTSPQYRRNLPIVSSDPPKRENDDS